MFSPHLFSPHLFSPHLFKTSPFRPYHAVRDPVRAARAPVFGEPAGRARMGSPPHPGLSGSG